MRKEAVVFDRALQQLCSIWNGKEYDGFPVVAIAPACMSPEEAAVGAEHASITFSLQALALSERMRK